MNHIDVGVGLDALAKEYAFGPIVSAWAGKQLRTRRPPYMEIVHKGAQSLIEPCCYTPLKYAPPTSNNILNILYLFNGYENKWMPNFLMALWEFEETEHPIFAQHSGSIGDQKPVLVCGAIGAQQICVADFKDDLRRTNGHNGLNYAQMRDMYLKYRFNRNKINFEHPPPIFTQEIKTGSHFISPVRGLGYYSFPYIIGPEEFESSMDHLLSQHKLNWNEQLLQILPFIQ